MKLTGFDLYRYSLPLRGPLVLKGTTLYVREGLLLRLSGDEDSEGWGEITPALSWPSGTYAQPLRTRRCRKSLRRNQGQ